MAEIDLTCIDIDGVEIDFSELTNVTRNDILGMLDAHSGVLLGGDLNNYLDPSDRDAMIEEYMRDMTQNELLERLDEDDPDVLDVVVGSAASDALYAALVRRVAYHQGNDRYHVAPNVLAQMVNAAVCAIVRESTYRADKPLPVASSVPVNN